jgi:hypothetical protein
MAAWEIVLLVIAGVFVVLFLGGLAGNARRRASSHHELTRRIAEADGALATARGDDRGWDHALLDAAARAAFAVRHPGVAIETLDLIQVVDLPGTDEDRALMRVTHAHGDEEIELQRTGDRWDAR